MRSAKSIDDMLDEFGRRLRNAEAEQRLCISVLGRLLGEARQHPNMTVSGAARAAGIERPVAYRFMTKADKSGRPD